MSGEISAQITKWRREDLWRGPDALLYNAADYVHRTRLTCAETSKRGKPCTFLCVGREFCGSATGIPTLRSAPSPLPLCAGWNSFCCCDWHTGDDPGCSLPFASLFERGAPSYVRSMSRDVTRCMLASPEALEAPKLNRECDDPKKPVFSSSCPDNAVALGMRFKNSCRTVLAIVSAWKTSSK
jgi:hypothetical protein